jgi:hypothetical protein
MRTVYEWDNPPAYISSEAGEDFDEWYKELVDQYGEPDFIVEREDWDVHTFRDGVQVNCIYPEPPPGMDSGRIIKARK